MKAAFLRGHNLWILVDGKEQQITTSGKVTESPQWSHDGKWILYQEEAPSEFEHGLQNELWVYNLSSGARKKIFYDGYSPSWAPNKHEISFLHRDILNISDLHHFYNISGGVDGYSWIPDGSGFILSSRAYFLPDGWTNPIIYIKKLSYPLDNLSETKNIRSLFTIPKEVGHGENKVMAIGASHFRYSPSQKWISFVVSPTASLAMDSNMLSAISADGKTFITLDEVILGVGEPKWAPNNDILAYIAGSGRIVYGFTNKELKAKDFPAAASLTPDSYAELDFTWIDQRTIVSSRVKEKEWSNDFKEHPLPSLYLIKLQSDKGMAITRPPAGFGDYNPKFLTSYQKLIWYRGSSITSENRDVWISEPDGKQAKVWLEDIDTISIYEPH
ncbi:TolB family protein [Rossellomorea sp. NS-SX7]|uniref:TolB family protein n=1 Tax=Rossellomorea sp. NS-SX7 TaxID=3463856 RepID=UPI004059AE0F